MPAKGAKKRKDSPQLSASVSSRASQFRLIG